MDKERGNKIHREDKGEFPEYASDQTKFIPYLFESKRL